MSEVYEVADAVKALLLDGAQPFAGNVTVKRLYLPRTDLKSIAPTDRPLILVYPAKDEFTLVGRDTQEEDVNVQIGVLMKLDRNVDPTDESGNETIDPMMQLCRQLCLAFKPGFYAADAAWIETKHAPLFDAEYMRTDRIFLSVISLKFKQADDSQSA